ncbi:EH signature domain-containing protein [Sphingobium sp. WCS2017Hpa-17]|uniref:EH signature domain-containing protein n=1 Tax=Sphingobium sp. WCS2017Hpa-17 TaxID=3073638 RepID=UPI00288BA8AF|nr:EH signature domain-containing protein [Sphingobium sp. WCS2017Hpa-17]
MSGLRETAERLARAGRLPLPPAERKTACERAANRLADRKGKAVGPSEPWEDFLRRLGDSALVPRAIARRDLRRMVGELWPHHDCDKVAPATLDAAVAANAKSVDRSLLTAYLRHFPLDHPSFDALRAASELTAERHDWPWRQRGQQWRLWDADNGPARLARALLTTDNPLLTLREAGLDGDLAHGGYVADAIENACEQAGRARGERAQEMGTRLIALFDRLAIGGMEALLAWALLAPWSSAAPAADYKDQISRLLIARIGDPRLAAAKWSAIEQKIADWQSSYVSGSITGRLRFWLAERNVRAFFSIVRKTTDRQDQWDAREAFWLGYIEVSAISDAWFAFGRRAEQLAGHLARDERVQYGLVSGGADPSHSALILSIGDLRIAEWSHNGSCRFWPDATARHPDKRLSKYVAPPLYQDRYDGNLLRTTVGPAGFQYVPHMSMWEWRFSSIIYRHTGIRHPVYGAGM